MQSSVEIPNKIITIVFHVSTMKNLIKTNKMYNLYIKSYLSMNQIKLNLITVNTTNFNKISVRMTAFMDVPHVSPASRIYRIITGVKYHASKHNLV
jgi:hypothetical protein